MSVRAGASEADGDPNYSRVQYVTWTTLRAASTPAPSLLLNQWKITYLPYSYYGGKGGEQKKETESTRHDRQRHAIAVA